MKAVKKLKPRMTILVVGFIITQCCCCIIPLGYQAQRNTIDITQIAQRIDEAFFSLRQTVDSNE